MEEPERGEKLNMRKTMSKSLDNQIKNDIRFYDEVISLHPEHTEAYYVRGYARYKLLGQYEEAIDDYDRIICLNPEHTEIYYLRGFATYLCRRLVEATRDLKLAIEKNLSPTDADSYYIRGIAKALLARSGMASADYEEAINLNPEYADAYYIRLAQNSKKAVLRNIDEECLPVPDFMESKVKKFHCKGEFLHEIREKQKAKRLQEEELHIRREEERLKKQTAIDKIREKFENDFIEADSFYEEGLSIILPRNEYEKEKIRFVQEWISQKTSMHPDDDQARAIGEIHGNIQLVARAGSGKTSTVINRALFLVEHCNIYPEELLLLAFNRKAVLEMRRRLLFIQHKDAETEFESQKRKALADPKKQKNVAKHQQQDFEENIIDGVAEKLGIGLPHVMTFHALAHAIVKPAETLIYDDPQNNIFALSGSLQEVIVEHIHGELESEIRELMLAHMRNIDWEKTMEEFLQYKRSLPCQTLNGEKVKSEGEKLIADFLFEHDIPYKYKPWCKGVRGWRPDFTIPKGRRKCVIIQHIGLGSGGKYQQKHNWETIELSPHFLSEGAESFKKILKKALEEKRLRCVKLPEEEIWLRIKKRAIDRFTEATKNFVNRCRQLSWAPVELEKRISKYFKTGNNDSRPSLVEKQFLKIVQRIYLDYLERLSITNEEDFNGLMQRAVNKINTGHTEFVRRNSRCDLRTIRYMFIDEFQDFSELFYKIVSAIRNLNQEVELFCVGDDWQAINGFAGSDLIFFENFDRFFGNSKRLYMTTNYRSQQSIVKGGNMLMSGLGKPATSNKTTDGILAVAYLDNFERSPVEDFHNDFITPAVLRLAQQFLKGNQDIVLLSRINHVAEHRGKNEEETDDETVGGIGIENFEKLIRSYLPEELRGRISVSTVHKYKGLERKTVFILDAIENHYPLIHPDWIFTKIFGEDLESVVLAERRLFYVAMTRAVDQLIIVTRATAISPFFEELISSGHVPCSIMWARIPPLTGGEASDKYLVKISNMKERGSEPTYNIKKELKESYYKWKGDEKYWWKTFPIKNFNIETIKSNTWARKADGVLVQIFDGTDTNCLASYTVESNRWECKFDNLEASDSKEGNTISILN